MTAIGMTQRPAATRWRRHAGTALMAAGGLLALYGLAIPAKSMLADILLWRSWTAADEDHAAPPPWPWADYRPVAKLVVLNGDYTAIVISEIRGRLPALGPAHIPGTALPGRAGHSVVAARRITDLDFLQLLRIGHVIRVELPGGNHTDYTVVDARVLDVRRVPIIIDNTIDMLTLVTRYPFDDWTQKGSRRYVVTSVALPADI